MSWPHRYVAGLPDRATKRGRFLFNNDEGGLEWRYITAEASETVDAVTLGLDNTGVEDCGAVLNNVTLANGTTLFFPEGTYRFSTQWVISKDYITVKGVGSSGSGPTTTFVCSESISMIRSVAPNKAPEFHNIRFEGVESEDGQDNATPNVFLLYRISGDNAHSYDGVIKGCYFLYGSSAFSVYFPNRFLVEDCVIDSNLTTGTNFYSPKNTTIRGCHYKNSGHKLTAGLNPDALKFSTGPVTGGTITNVLDTVLVVDNLFEDSAQDGIDVHLEHVRNLIITNNHIRNCDKAMDLKPAIDDNEAFVIEGGGLRGWHNVIVEGNTMFNAGNLNFNNLLEGEPEGRTARCLTIGHNTLYNGAIVITGAATSVLNNLVLSGNTVNNGHIDVRFARDSSVVGNSVYNSDSGGVTIRSVANLRTVFANNSVTGAMFIFSTSNTDCSVVGNMVNGANLRFDAATQCQIANNVIKGALQLSTSVTDTHIFGNFAFNSGDSGLSMSNGTGCVYMNNFFRGNRFGVLTSTTHPSTAFIGNYCTNAISGSGNGAIRVNAATTAGLFARNYLTAPLRPPIWVENTSATAIFYDNIVVKPDDQQSISQALTSRAIIQNVLAAKSMDSYPSGFAADYGDVVPTIAHDSVLAWVCTAGHATAPTWKAILKSDAPP